MGKTMPKMGDTRVIHSPNGEWRKEIYDLCARCKGRRWVRVDNKNRSVTSGLCRSCANARSTGVSIYSDNRNWQGGRSVDGKGYVRVKLHPDDFFFSMTKRDGYVLEHRLVMAKHLGRCLHPWEIVHHKGTKYPSGSIENRSDNRIENLQLVSNDRHMQITIMESEIKRLKEALSIKDAEHQQKLAEMFEEIEKHYTDKALSLRSIFFEFGKIEWQALKSRTLGGK